MNAVETFPNGISLMRLEDQFQLTGQKVTIGIIDSLRDEESKCLLQVRFECFLAFVELLLDFG